MEWLVENWYLVLAGVVCCVGAIYGVRVFMNKPTSEQVANIKEWLRWAVMEAERELQGGTGQAKLRRVYDMAIAKFQWLSFISFDNFSVWVDDALVWMKEQLEVNPNIKAYVEGK